VLRLLAWIAGVVIGIAAVIRAVAHPLWASQAGAVAVLAAIVLCLSTRARRAPLLIVPATVGLWFADLARFDPYYAPQKVRYLDEAPIGSIAALAVVAGLAALATLRTPRAGGVVCGIALVALSAAVLFSGTH
jgi:hypothetical protein